MRGSGHRKRSRRAGLDLEKFGSFILQLEAREEAASDVTIAEGIDEAAALVHHQSKADGAAAVDSRDYLADRVRRTDKKLGDISARHRRFTWPTAGSGRQVWSASSSKR